MVGAHFGSGRWGVTAKAVSGGLSLEDLRVPRERGVGILQEYPEILFFLCRRYEITRLGGTF